MTAIVRAQNLGRWYGEVVGLGDLTVDIEPGITGLVGPNGAGKSTFMKLMVGELRPARGSLSVLDRVPFGNRALYRELGFCPQQDALYEHQTGRQFVRDLLRLAGWGRREADRLAVRAMERVGLEEAMDRKVSGYSKGMRQRTRLAQAIAHGPRLVIADEPLTGLDPIARRQTLELFRGLADDGCSVIISSHVLHERKQTNILVQTYGEKPDYDRCAEHGILLAGEWVASEYRLADAAADTGRLAGQNIAKAQP